MITALGNLGSALSVNIGMLIAFRGITAIGASACVAMGAGVVTEVFDDNERGRALSWNNALPITMTAVSPMISGLLAQYFGWRSVFWFYTICYGVLFICVIFLLPETKKNLKGDSQRSKLKQLAVVNPASSLQLLRYPNLLLTSIYMGLMFFVNYAVNTSFTWAYSNQYGFNPVQVGLCYMLGAFGYCVGAYTAGSLSDRMYRQRVQKAKDKNERVYPEMRLSRASLAPAAVLMVGGYAAYGWCIQANAHFIFGMLMQMFAQLGMMIWVCFLTVYAIQCFPDRGASVQGIAILLCHNYTCIISKTCMYQLISFHNNL
ncbi:major facilitator superfamily domain-containing protein [Zychaea mexicana]|uniref:major facilitator superfamily domain-containing protein n=1 Tax=Zychaea mexicana TaxID=64656 RepID=UPI0022FEB9C6|nr:major facilitator superfamily domain-containing protein [Zychaea mexicana]KAI9489156.1 major facilitator superfamily domain-containing protein [Zychaea mexicana]